MLVTQYVQSALFLLLAVSAGSAWLGGRERRQAHLAWATGLFGASQLVSSFTATLYDQTAGQTPPRALTILSGILIFVAMYAFLLFLSDFLRFPWALHATALLATLTSVVLVVIERPDIRFVGGRLQRIEVRNPIPYTVFVQYAIAYLAVVLGVLALAFVVYGLRSRGLARRRMLATGAGFAMLFAAVGLLPFLLFGKPSTSAVRNVTLAVRALALGSAPLLYLGFTPPRWLARRRRTAGGTARG